MHTHRFHSADLAAVLPSGGRTLVLGCSGESLLLAAAVMESGSALGAMTFTGIFVPGVNRQTYLANSNSIVETFFLTPELKAAGAAVRFLPLCVGDIQRRLQTITIDAALFMVAPPDADGNCSFGPTVDFLAELWPRIPVRIAHINPQMPRTHGHPGIPLKSITAYTEGAQPLVGSIEPAKDPLAAQIAAYTAPFIIDGATLQVGLGKLPSAVLSALTQRRNLRIHSGMIGDAVMELEGAGALAGGPAVTTGVAIGSERLYNAIVSPTYNFQPASITHSPRVIADIDNFVAINSAIEVDLFGQVYAEMGPTGLLSGPGGASDYARGARAANGLRIIVLPASANQRSISRVVLPGAGAGPVSLGRMDVDIIVTEFGAADLRGHTYMERAELLINIAAPDHRPALRAGWERFTARC